MTVRAPRFPGSSAIARDVSVTGLKIEGGGVSAKLSSGPQLAKGEQFQVTIELDLINETIKLPVEVVSIAYTDERGEFEAGLRFTQIGEKELKTLEFYIQTVKESLNRFI